MIRKRTIAWAIYDAIWLATLGYGILHSSKIDMWLIIFLAAMWAVAAMWVVNDVLGDIAHDLERRRDG